MSASHRVETKKAYVRVHGLGWVTFNYLCNFVDFLTDLQRRDAAGVDVRSLWAPGQLPDDAVTPTGAGGAP